MSAEVVVVGAGISGIACARRLADAGVGVQVLDRGRRMGGRLAARTLRDLPGDPHPVDLGAPYLTVSEDGFLPVVDGWLLRGLLREWTDTFVTAGPDGLGEAKTGPMRYSAPRGLRSLVEDLADGLDVTGGETVDEVGPGREVAGHTPDAVVLAMPGPQATRLLREHHPDLAAVADQPYSPALTLVARFEQRAWPEIDGVFVSDVPELRWIADDGRSRGDAAPVLVAHGTPGFSGQHLDDPPAAGPAMVAALRGVLSIDAEPVETFVHRWTYAQPAQGRDAVFHLADNGIGLCGDGWAEKSRIEAAWLSGDALGGALVSRLT